jgi:hypothetical protein
VDEQRLAQEIAYLAERWDINEELVRFRSHNALFRELLAADAAEPVGKRLSFLVQEMHREANTIGSKANHAGIAHQRGWDQGRGGAAPRAGGERRVSGPDFPVVVSAPSGAGQEHHRRRSCAPARRRALLHLRHHAQAAAGRGGRRQLPLRGVDEFRRMIAAGELMEWAEVHGNYYGTPLANVPGAPRGEAPAAGHRRAGRAAGARAGAGRGAGVRPAPLGRRAGGAAVQAGDEAPEVLRRRLANARDEVRVAGEFDHVIVNDLLDQAVGELDLVFRGEAGRIRPVERLEDAIERICAEIDEHLARMGGEVSRHAS